MTIRLPAGDEAFNANRGPDNPWLRDFGGDGGAARPPRRSVLDDQDEFDFATRAAAAGGETLEALLRDPVGLDAPDFTDNLVKTLEDERDGFLGDAPGDAARAAAATEFGAVIDRARRLGAGIEQGTRAARRAANAERALAGFVRAALNEPARAGEHLEGGLRVLARAGEAGTDAAGIAERTAQFRRDLALGAIRGHAQLDAGLAQSRFAAGDFDDLIPDDETRSLVTEELARAGDTEARQAEIDGERADITARLDAARARTLFEARFERALEDNSVTANDIETARLDGQITPATAARLDARLDTAHEARLQRQAQIDGAEALIEAGARINPDNAEERAALNAHFDDIAAPSFAGLDGHEPAFAEDAYARRAGVIPDRVLDTLVFGLRSEDPARLTQAADRLNALREDPALAPQIAGALDPDRVEQVLVLERSKGAGLDPQERIRIAGEDGQFSSRHETKEGDQDFSQGQPEIPGPTAPDGAEARSTESDGKAEEEGNRAVDERETGKSVIGVQLR